MIRLAHLPLMLISACATFPALDDRITDVARAADYPTLAPIETLLAAADGISPTADEPAVDARVAALRARAAALRGPVIDRTTRDALNAGVATGPLR